MLADSDLLLIAVFCTADDLLPGAAKERPSSRSFWTCKDVQGLERHGARTLHGLRVRPRQHFLALAAAIALNHRLGRPSRSLAPYTT
jgi:hypothetical protein